MAADQSKLALAEWAMNCALKNGADEVAVSVSDQKGVKITRRDGQLEELKESSQRSLGDCDIFSAALFQPQHQ